MMPLLPSKPNAKILAHRAGHRGEALAALFLRLKLYRIIARRYKTPVGEIDLIARRFGTIVFVEVKARGRAGGEAAALMAVNQARIARAARHWLARNPDAAQANCRFDVIFLAPGRWPRHVINAFDATG
jgi:putative endonuclease